jgi:ATP-dependent RNA helicase DeaD
MSETTFSDYALSNEIVRALESLAYTEPTEVQREVIPVALEQKDLVVKSQTGSGKTAAYGIPLCELVDWNENKPQVLVLTPTRELALQVNEDITNIGRFKRIKSMAVYGKAPFHVQKAELKQRTHMVVGTPDECMTISSGERLLWSASNIW